MSDEIELTHKTDPYRRIDPSQAINATEKIFGKILDVATVGAVYGIPIQNGDTLVVPSAEVFGVVGFGGGAGGGSDDKGNVGGGGGTGGTGRVLSRPVAAIVITPGSVRVEPIVDVTKIALAAFTTAGFMLAMVARMSSKSARRAMEE